MPLLNRSDSLHHHVTIAAVAVAAAIGALCLWWRYTQEDTRKDDASNGAQGDTKEGTPEVSPAKRGAHYADVHDRFDIIIRCKPSQPWDAGYFQWLSHAKFKEACNQVPNPRVANRMVLPVVITCEAGLKMWAYPACPADLQAQLNQRNCFPNPADGAFMDDFKGNCEKLIELIAPVLLGPMIYCGPVPLEQYHERILEDKRAAQFTGREWLFDKVLNQRGCRSNVTLILGQPGAGKSAIMQQLVQGNRGLDVWAYHFCDAHNDSTKDPVWFVKRLTCMLAQRDSFRKALQSSLALPETDAPRDILTAMEGCSQRQHGRGESAESFLEDFVLTPLHKMKAPQTKAAMLVDALDEAALTHSSSTIATLLNAKADRFPSWLRIIASSRLNCATEQLKMCDAERIVVSSDRNLADIERFVGLKLQAMVHSLGAAGDAASSMKLTAELACMIDHHIAKATHAQERCSLVLTCRAWYFLWSGVQKMVCEKSGGNFLFAETLLRQFQQSYVEKDRLFTLRDLQDIPVGMTSLYRWFFERQFLQDVATTRHFREAVAPLLAAIVAAQEPLTCTQLVHAMLSHHVDSEEDQWYAGLKSLREYMHPWSACLNGHALHKTAVGAKTSGHPVHFCDACGRDNITEGIIHRCMKCDYDVCDKCMMCPMEHVPVRLYHTSLGEWLSEQPSDSDLFVDLSQGHAALAVFRVIHLIASSFEHDSEKQATALQAMGKYLAVKNLTDVVAVPMPGCSSQPHVLHIYAACKHFAAHSEWRASDRPNSERGRARREARWIELMKATRLDMQATNECGHTAAHYAARNEHEGCLRVLVKLGEGASLMAGNNFGWTPAHVAAEIGGEGCLRVLAELGAGESLKAGNANGSTPAHVAAENGHEGCLRVLAELGASESLKAVNQEEWTPAHVAARNGREGCLRVLAELGASESLKAPTQYGDTPAHIAAENGDEGCLRVLAELGAGESLKAVNMHGAMPAHTAVNGGHVGCLRVLAELGASESLRAVDNDGRTPAHWAANAPARMENEKCLRVLAELGVDESLKAADNDGRTPAHWAANQGYEQCLRVLAELGAGESLKAADKDGQAPAHWAAEKGHEKCLCVLAELGANESLKAADKDGLVPAHMAFSKGNYSCLRVLEELGAGLDE